MANYHAYTQTVADGTATSVVRPSDWNSAHVQQLALSGNTLGSSVVSGLDIQFVGGNNVTLSADTANSKVVWSVGNYLTTAMASIRGTDFVQATAAFAGTNASGTIASNGISVSVGNYITTAMASNRGTDFVQATAAFAGTNASGTIASNGISVSVGNYITTAAQSNQVVNSVNGSTGQISLNVGSSLSSSTNGSSITFGLASNITTALQSAGAYLTTAAQSNQVVNSINGSTGVFSFNTGSSLSSSRNGNSITFGLASNITTALQSTGNYLTTARASNDAIGLNTAVTNVTATINSSGFSFNAAGYAGTGTSATNASITLNSNGLAISVAAPGGGGGAGTNTALALTNLTGTLSANTNGISLSLQNLDDHFSAWSIVGNTAGDNSYTLSTEGAFVLQGGNNVTLSGNSNTLVISAAGGTTNQTGPNIAAGGATATSGTVIFSNSNNITFGLNGQTMTASYADPTETIFYRPNDFLTTVGNPINNSASVFYCPLDHNLSATRLNFMASVSVTTANNTSSAGYLWSITACLYTLNGATLSSISSITTASEVRWQSNNTGSVTGAMIFSAPLTVSANADKYWMAVQMSTRATGLTGAPTTSLGNTMSIFGVGSAQGGAFSAREPGQSTANSNGWFSGMGMYSGTTNFSTIGLSNLTQQGSNMQRANIGIRMLG